jgi:hypothetical protein
MTSIWPTIEADGCTWEVRVVSGTDSYEDKEIIEFTPTDGTKPVRRLAVGRGGSEGMSQQDLQNAYRQARPIGGDYYGRPGKRMPDVGEH